MTSNIDWQPAQLCGLSQDHLTRVDLDDASVMVHQSVAKDLQALHSAAVKDGFRLTVASGFRDFARQKLIWDNKITGRRPVLGNDGQPIDIHALSPEKAIQAILRWSALPGASRHHWGTDFDLYDKQRLPQDTQLLLEPWEYLTGHQAEFYQWLQQNMAHYGFFFPYQEDKGGVAVEPWHVSHQATASKALSKLTPKTLSDVLRGHPVEGLDQVLESIDVIYTQYITNISQAQKPC